MKLRRKKHKFKKVKFDQKNIRIYVLMFVFLILAGLVFFQLFRLQVLEHRNYVVKAARQYNVLQKIPAKRGEIFWQDLSSNEKLPLVLNKSVFSFFVVPKNILEINQSTKLLSDVLNLDQAEILHKIAKLNDPYEILVDNLSPEQKEEIIQLLNKANFSHVNYGFEEKSLRYYPEADLTSHVTGFLGFADDGNTRVGQYGAEEYFNSLLTGEPGLILADRDLQGRPIVIGERIIEKEKNGKDIFLTLDKNIQYQACNLLVKYIQKYNAESGSVIIINPQNGEVMALCGEPAFDPNIYGTEEIQHFINPVVSTEYEPGSIFKPITMAVALDVGAVTPWTTYVDKGQVLVDKYVIKNADGKAHGVNNMIDVLDKSLNTGAIFVVQSAGAEKFRQYVSRFGFGKLTGIELAGEVDGDIGLLEKNSDIYTFTASFGQGITVSPIQILTAYATIARGGKLIRPTIIANTDQDSFSQREMEQVISPKTAETLSAMLVSVVNNGYGRKAGVEGYAIAGKTGTAQIPKSDGPGYSKQTIHSFIGFGPVGNFKPAFVMLTKLDKPTEVVFSSDSAAPLFGEIAEFLVKYLEIPPNQ